MTGRVNKGIGGKFTVFCRENGASYLCAAKGKLKKDGEIFIGDFVEFDERERIITRISARKNFLERPPVSNIDLVVVVVAPSPEPDFLLVDKIIINAIEMDIEPIICVNKIDKIDGIREDKTYRAAEKAACISEKNDINKPYCISENTLKSSEIDLIRRVQDNYGEVANIICVSALNNDVKALLDLIEARTVCLAGQSAVGKTSAVNAVLKREIGKIGGLSEKSGRGKHTTRHNEIFLFRDSLLIDTPGFSELNIPLMNPLELSGYYADFTEFATRCKYKGCSHTKEDESECAVKRAVKDEEICKERYARYLELFDDLTERRKKMY